VLRCYKQRTKSQLRRCYLCGACRGYKECRRRKGQCSGSHSIGHYKRKVYMYMCPIPNGFRDTAISLYSPLYTVQTSYTPCPHTSCKVHWCLRRNFLKCITLLTILELYSEITLYSEIWHMYIYTFLLRMTDTMTSQNIDLSSWDTPYNVEQLQLRKTLEAAVRRVELMWDSRRPVRSRTRKLRNLRRSKPLPGDNRWRYSRLRRPCACCSELQKVWISDSALVTCSYVL
jgi:hypothetical protein